MNNQEFIEEDFFNKILELYDFFAYKESSLSFEISYTNTNNYKFTTKLWGKKNKLDYFNNLLVKSGLKLEPNTENKPFESWSIKINTQEEIELKTKNCINYIINNYTLELPNSLDELKTFHEIALFKKREFGDSLEGTKKFNQWLTIEREKMYK